MRYTAWSSASLLVDCAVISACTSATVAMLEKPVSALA
jgi:hypothetical protein